MRTIKRLLILFCLLLASAGSAWAEIVVVVDAKSGVEQLSQDDVINIFLGRHRKLPTGIAAVPVDLQAGSRLYADFYRKLVDKTPSEISAYWSRLYFSGKTRPPVQMASPADAVSHVLGTPGGIGYIERQQLDPRLRVVLSFSP